jgi:hypothetical protein
MPVGAHWVCSSLRRGSPAPATGALEWVRRAEEEDGVHPAYVGTTKRPEHAPSLSNGRPEPSAPHVRCSRASGTRH